MSGFSIVILAPEPVTFHPQQNLSNSALMVRFSFSPLLNVVRYYSSLAVHSYDRVKRRRQVSAMKGQTMWSGDGCPKWNPKANLW